MDKHKSVWILQMMKYFMVTKDYLQVNVVSDDPTGIYKNHFWLVSRSNVKYPIIHISDSSDQQRNINIESYKETENKIRSLVNNQQGEVLDISIKRLLFCCCSFSLYLIIGRISFLSTLFFVKSSYL